MADKIRTACLFLLGLMLVIAGCNKNPYKADISSEDLQIKIKRFEVDLFNTDLDSIGASIPRFYKEYGDFFDLFNYKIINIGGAGQRTYPDYLKIFLTDYLNNEVYKKTMETFPDLEDLEKKLTMAFRYYHHYYPDEPVPQVITYISRFNQSVVTAESIIGIGLDKYLGRDCEYYRELGLNQYYILNMHRDKIPSDCMTA